MNLITPENYEPVLSVMQTQEAIKYIRDTFQREFGKELGLLRISAPLFVTKSSGLNDNLNGIERPVSFDIQELPDERVEVVQSLAKWKRFALKKYGFKEHEVWYKYPEAVCHLADEVYFITSQELEDRYPDLSVKDRENAITREHKCVFIKQIGHPLKRSGKPHDGRAPDYDDWNLNGDLLFWLPSLNRALEISSMGIRVDEDTIVSQCKASHCEGRLTLPYHQMIQNKELPYTIGGGIGQSRLCMLLLNKAHVGEVQASIWPQKMIDECEKHNIHLL